MRHIFLAAAMTLASNALALAQTADVIVTQHVLPAYELLSEEAASLADVSHATCNAEDPSLQSAYHNAFDAWLRVSHLRFGPSETNDRAFALAFWPDTRGNTPKSLRGLLSSQDTVVRDPESFATVSIAARGFYALEFLLFDEAISTLGDAPYRCQLLQAIAADIAANAAAIEDGWKGSHAALMSNAGNETYRSEDEALQQFFTALATGLEFTADTRLGRPMGSFERPRPNRAEARRSQRSLRHVILSLQATRELAALLSDDDTVIDQAFASAIGYAGTLDDPVFAGVSEPQARFRVETLQNRISEIRTLLSTELGPKLGFAAGFNSLDGD